MPIAKEAFYEGAALHLVVRTCDVTSLRYAAPFYILNERLLVLLKYSTKGRSPWGFTFLPDEQALLRKGSGPNPLVIGLICGADGVVALTYEGYTTIAELRSSAIHVSCYRRHREHYEVNGPSGKLDRKVPPSKWPNILRDL